MAEFDYKQRPFTRRLTDKQYDSAVGRTPSPKPSPIGNNPRKPYHPSGRCLAPTCGMCK